VTWLFWGCVLTLTYTYAGFPALLVLRSRLHRRPYRRAAQTPKVSVLIAARNEAKVIGARVENLLALDYPEENLQLIVASDGSDDDTNEIVERIGGDRVSLLSLGRVGKAVALDTAVEASHGDVLVFSDANSLFRADAVRKLVAPLADPEVGGVAGNQVYLPTDTGDASVVGEEQYWNFDRSLKLAQSRAGSVTQATGAIYAIRRALFRPLRGDVNDDMLTSLRVVEQGYRLVFEPDAVAYERVSESAGATFSRRVRIMVRGLRCVVVMRGLLDPRRYGFFSLQFLSHKLLLRTAVIPLVLLAVTNGVLWSHGLFYRATAVGQLAFYALGALGIALGERRIAKAKPIALPAYFCLVNAAAATAIWRLLRGRTDDSWEPDRGRPRPGDHTA